MLLSENTTVNEQGHLEIGGCDAVALAEQYGTPLYVMNEELIRKSCRAYRSAIEKHYGGRGLPLFAAKAFCCKEICRIMREEGMGLDVVSGGELHTAIESGFDPALIYFEGNYKTKDELRLALQAGVGHIVVDSVEELRMLAQFSVSNGTEQAVLLRVKPGVDAHTHDCIRTGQIDSKFGFALETGEALAAARSAIALTGVRLVGLHCHIGSQIFELEAFQLAAERLLGLMTDLRRETGTLLDQLDLGGGFGIQYIREDAPRPYESFIEVMANVIRETCAALDYPLPRLLVEPGRSIVGPAGITLYTAGIVKSIPDIRDYVVVDGGMCDNPRYALYRSAYTVVAANRMNDPCDSTVTVAGRCCESGDLIQEQVPLPAVQVGDLLAVLATGAYNYSMSLNYNRLPRPAVVMVSGGQARLIVRRETYEDLLRTDI